MTNVSVVIHYKDNDLSFKLSSVKRLIAICLEDGIINNTSTAASWGDLIRNLCKAVGVGSVDYNEFEIYTEDEAIRFMEKYMPNKNFEALLIDQHSIYFI